jgi:CRISPR-associated protein Csb2
VIGIQLRFLAGRFHGTGWHQAHNEGIPEWPPSPWRVLRALVGAAYAEDLSPADVEPLMEKLRSLPRYQLPLAIDAHTRHYMPDTDDAGHKKTKVFDAFVAVEGGAKDPRPVTMAWSVDLTADERILLASLCRRVSYLGRAESWAEVSAVDVDGDRWDCWPDERERGAAATTLLALSAAEELATWAKEQPAPKKGRDVPRTLWDVLTFDGERYRDEGWSGVPGTRLVRYVFADRPFRRSVIPSSGRRTSARPTVARFVIRSAVLPRLHDAVMLGERLRVSAMSQSKTVSGSARKVFSGHGESASDHQHAMYLSSSEDATNAEMGFIDHLVIAARSGFDEEDVLALQKLRRLWGRGGHDLDLILVGLGQSADFGGVTSPRAPLLAESRIWESVTPFVPTRHPKKVRGVRVDTIEDQLRRGCEQLIGVAPVEIAPVGDRAEWSGFRRQRLNGGGRRGPDSAFGARLSFERPVRGPIAIGYGAHFGLGVFAAVKDER